MNCPHCPDKTLVLSERQGVEIDYCPQCRGVWLDRGELDKLIERSTTRESSSGAARDGHHRRPDFADTGDRNSAGAYGHGQRRGKSWLSEIFD